MWQYIVGILLLRRLGLTKPLRSVFLLVLAVLSVIVLVYTANLFLTLEERTRVPHVHTHSAR